MKNYRYILEKYNGMKMLYSCPNCNKSKVFTKYIDTKTNEYLSNTVGRCSREIKCGYHYKPKQYFNDNNISYKKAANVTDYIKPKTRLKKVKTKIILFNS
ncbi:PG0870-related protein [Tenacibaculum piscium]|uniref:PG0870-related protein n=1 Tax=Tenacibaculum piscium TaxID=1458515 RepID=UPI00374D3DE8